MLDVYDQLSISHQIHDGKRRSEDVLALNNSQLQFTSLLLEPRIQNGLAKCGFVYLSPIQKKALPLSLIGTSIITHAKSGTGKTLVYVLTALNHLLKKKPKFVGCLVLLPTREIAKQTYDVFKKIACFISDLKIEYFIGGTPLDIDIIKSRNCHIVIGTPGRIKHLIELGSLKLDMLETLILDEVDALLDQKEFAISRLVSYLPSKKQTVVCTATFSRRVAYLLALICPNMEYVTVDKEMASASAKKTTETENDCFLDNASNILIGVKQYVATVYKDSSTLDAIRKRDKLIEILQNFKYDQCFVFVNYVSSVKSIFNFLARNDFEVSWISSEQVQSERLNSINQLKLNRSRILVTTDVASRGIDVHNVNLVVNVGIPCPPNVYIHRMGRAGRYGSEGAVITIVHEGDEMDELKNLLRVVCTDTVNLFSLPKQVTPHWSLDELEIIVCKPSSTYEHNHEWKECYRASSGESRNSSHVSDTARATKTKKKQKKKKAKEIVIDYPNVEGDGAILQTSPEMSVATGSGSLLFYEKDLSPTSNFDTNTARKDDESRNIHTAANEKLENTISRYVKWLRMKMDYQDEKVNTAFLRLLFATEEKELERKHEQSEYDSDSVIRYARLVMEKNAFLDDQKFVCGIDELVRVRNKNIFANRRGDSYIRDAICQVRQLGLSNVTSFSSRALNTDDTVNGSSSVPRASMRNLKKVCNSYNLSEELYDTFEDANENLKNHWNAYEKENFETEILFPRSKVTSEEVHTPLTISTMTNTNTSTIATVAECVNDTFFKLTTTCRHSPILLPSLRIFVSQEVEQRIWGHHFNFISKYVR